MTRYVIKVKFQSEVSRCEPISTQTKNHSVTWALPTRKSLFLFECRDRPCARCSEHKLAKLPRTRNEPSLAENARLLQAVETTALTTERCRLEHPEAPTSFTRFKVQGLGPSRVYILHSASSSNSARSTPPQPYKRHLEQIMSPSSPTCKLYSSETVETPYPGNLPTPSPRFRKRAHMEAAAAKADLLPSPVRNLPVVLAQHSRLRFRVWGLGFKSLGFPQGQSLSTILPSGPRVDM